MADEDKIGDLVSKELKKINDSIDDTHGKLAEAVKRQENEIKELGGTNTGTRKRLDTLEQRYDQEAADLKGLIDSLGENFSELKEAFAKSERANAESWERAGEPKKSLKSQFDNDKNYQSFNPETDQKSGKIMLGRLDDYAETSVKDITGGGALDSVLGRSLWVNRIYGLPFNDNVRLRDYMHVEKASGYSVHYVERTSFVNDAAFQSAPGALKPESDWTFVERTATPDVLAHWTRITNQQARQTPFIVDYIKNEMRAGLDHAETRQILFADGSAPGEFTGIFNHARVQTYNEDASGTMIDTLRRSEDQLGDHYLVGDLYVLNHRDWTDIELLKDSEKRYIWVQVQDGGTARMWRKPVLTTRAMPRGNFVNGAFRSCATLLDYEDTTAQMFDQHEDYVVRNMKVLRLERTIALAITCPEGFVVGNFAGGSGS